MCNAIRLWICATSTKCPPSTTRRVLLLQMWARQRLAACSVWWLVATQSCRRDPRTCLASSLRQSKALKSTESAGTAHAAKRHRADFPVQWHGFGRSVCEEQRCGSSACRVWRRLLALNMVHTLSSLTRHCLKRVDRFESPCSTLASPSSSIPCTVSCKTTIAITNAFL